jgi:hypothetical protein
MAIIRVSTVAAAVVAGVWEVVSVMAVTVARTGRARIRTGYPDSAPSVRIRRA